MKPQHILDLKGKHYVTHPGLVAEAHKRGILDLRMTTIQTPAPENGMTAVFHTAVHLTDRETGALLAHVEDIGDANVENVGAAIKPHYIRMAATRSQARALGTALNIDAVSIEELIDPEPASAEMLTRIREGLRLVSDSLPEAELTALTKGEADALYADLRARYAKIAAAAKKPPGPGAPPAANPGPSLRPTP